MIAQLAESRKAQKSIYAFGPVASISVPVRPARPSVPNPSSQPGNPDLLGSILASQTQLTTFGKDAEATRPRPRNLANSNRVLGAILASQATLSRLDESARFMEQSRKPHVPNSCVKPENISSKSRSPVKNCGTRQSDATDQNTTSSTSRQSTSEGTSNGSHPVASHSNGQSSGELTSGNGKSGGSDGNGEDPNWNRKKKTDPEDKKEDPEEEDVDLYSDIESVDEENDQPESLPKNEVSNDKFLELYIS